MGPEHALKDNARRLFHGRAKGLSYNIDSIPPFIIIDAFEDLREETLSKIVSDYPTAEGIFYRNRRAKEKFRALKGQVPSQHILFEDGLKYEVDFSGNQNIGLFLDMRPGRELVRSLSKDKKILNLFAYTCSLSVAAKSGEAKQVVNVDMKKSFLKTGEKNHQLNGLTGSVSYLSYEIMKSLGGLRKKGPFDLIIIDPPSGQRSFDLKKDYPKLLKEAAQWVGEKGQILACLNDPFLTSDFLLECLPDMGVTQKLYGCFEEEDPEKGLKMILFTRAEN